MSINKQAIIDALKADDFELQLTEEDNGKNIRDLFREHAIKIIEKL